eukprot:NODE_6943_length_597_cov_2.009124_g5949_i0.p2 GENE.NODE_6943_length_597_cov_2.009124_g5949_i0~~NODE_6943_length_597_cov_2.009124_g5949_i0.p2  ORF type:complete len:90 (+),score=4.40 NODE_6943_length_597_cov_2.009124_g5949_i0:130-399(+)
MVLCDRGRRFLHCTWKPVVFLLFLCSLSRRIRSQVCEFFLCLCDVGQQCSWEAQYPCRRRGRERVRFPATFFPLVARGSLCCVGWCALL